MEAFEERVARVRLTGRPQFYRCEPEWRWAPPPLPDYDLWCVLEGRGDMRLLGADYPLIPGRCFVVPPGATPRATHQPDHRLYVFACHFLFDGEPDTESALDDERLPAPGFVLRDTTLLRVLAQCCVAGVQRGDALGAAQARLYLQQMLLHLWEESRAPSSAPPADTRLSEIAGAIREDPGRDWSVQAQAQLACLSPAQYTRRFTRRFGIPPNRFVIETRLERAAQLIKETEMTLTQIATALGYRDLFFFSRQFKSYRGVAPGTLRF